MGQEIDVVVSVVCLVGVRDVSVFQACWIDGRNRVVQHLRTAQITTPMQA